VTPISSHRLGLATLTQTHTKGDWLIHGIGNGNGKLGRPLAHPRRLAGGRLARSRDKGDPARSLGSPQERHRVAQSFGAPPPPVANAGQ